MAKSYDPRVLAIRSDKLVGKGSCSSMDECWEDSELVEELNQDKISSPEAALRWAKEREGLWLESGLNVVCHMDDQSVWHDMKDRLHDLEGSNPEA